MSSESEILVAVEHGDPLTAAGIASAISMQRDIRLVGHGERPHGRSAFGEQASRAPHIVIADYVRGLATLEALRSARAHGPRALRQPAVMLVTRLEKEWEIRRAMNLGARGYLLQNCSLEELIDGIRTLHRGSRAFCRLVADRVADSINREPLTERETEALELLSQGLCNKAIATKMGIAVGTVKVHLKGVFEKLEVNTRTQAVMVAEERGLTSKGRRVSEGDPRGAPLNALAS